MSKKRLATNMIANVIAFVINIGIGFFLSPYIVRTLGKEAYGFMPMLNNLITIAQIMVIPLNSMGMRYITIAYHENDEDALNKYFNSLLFSNLMIAAVLLIPALLSVVFLDKLINIPPELIADVRISFVFILAIYFITIIFSAFSTSTYARNRLDLSATRMATSQILRAGIIVLFFVCLKPRIVYLAVGSFAATLFVAITDYRFTKKLLPNVKINKRHYDFNAVKELVSLGIWAALIQLSSYILSGLDLIIANKYIDASAMGILAIAKTMPSYMNSFISTISAPFNPPIVIQYAKNGIKGALTEIDKALKIIGVIVCPVLAFLVGFGDVFYGLWVPQENAHILQILSILTILPLFFTAGMGTLTIVYTLTKKPKLPTIVILIGAVLSTTIVLLLLRFTTLGIYAIAAVSSIFMTLNYFFFVPAYAAWCLKVKWTTFYPRLIKLIAMMAVSVGISTVIKHFAHIDNWISLIFYAALSSIIILAFCVLAQFRKDDYAYVGNLLKNKLPRKEK